MVEVAETGEWWPLQQEAQARQIVEEANTTPRRQRALRALLDQALQEDPTGALWRERAARDLVLHHASACYSEPRLAMGALQLAHAMHGEAATRAMLESGTLPGLPTPAEDVPPAALAAFAESARDWMEVRAGRPWTPPDTFPELHAPPAPPTRPREVPQGTDTRPRTTPRTLPGPDPSPSR